MQMADGAAELQDAVVKLCCLWWQKELPGKADMVPQMIPYLLYQATVSGMHWEGCPCHVTLNYFPSATEVLWLFVFIAPTACVCCGGLLHFLGYGQASDPHLS